MSAQAFINARLIDPDAGTETEGGLIVSDGRIAEYGPAVTAEQVPAEGGMTVTDCGGDLLAPGLIDLRVSLGADGAEPAPVNAAAKAAAAGGITTACLLPRGAVPLTTPDAIEGFCSEAEKTGGARLLPFGVLSENGGGTSLAELALMAEAGAIGFTDAPGPVADSRVLRQAMAYAASLEALVVTDPDDPGLSTGGEAHEGELSTRLGLGGWPAIAETIGLARDIALADLTGARLHVGLISTAKSVSMIAEAKDRGLNLTCGVAAHHLRLNENDLVGYVTARKTRPPLRSPEDREALAAGIAAGVIDVICSDHTPVTAEDKAVPFTDAGFGALGLETLLPVALGLVHDGYMDLPALWQRLSRAPAWLLGLESGRLAPGAPADLVRIRPTQGWRVDPRRLTGTARNTPFSGMTLEGRAIETIVHGRSVYAL